MFFCSVEFPWILLVIKCMSNFLHVSFYCPDLVFYIHKFSAVLPSAFFRCLWTEPFIQSIGNVLTQLHMCRMLHKVIFSQRCLTGLNSEFSFASTDCYTKVNEPSLSYYIPIAWGRILGAVSFPRMLPLCKMQTSSSRIWTRVTVSISYNDNHYTTCAFIILMPWNISYHLIRPRNVTFLFTEPRIEPVTSKKTPTTTIAFNLKSIVLWDNLEIIFALVSLRFLFSISTFAGYLTTKTFV